MDEKGGGNSIKNAIATLRPQLLKDDLARGIWAIKIVKGLGQRFRRHIRRNMPTKDRLIAQGMAIMRMCELCDKEQEFFQVQLRQMSAQGSNISCGATGKDG